MIGHLVARKSVSKPPTSSTVSVTVAWQAPHSPVIERVLGGSRLKKLKGLKLSKQKQPNIKVI